MPLEEYTLYQDFALLYDHFMYDVDYPAWARYLAGILERIGLRDPCSVLDAACGTGSISIALAQMGYSVTGSDASANMLEQAQAKARKSGLAVPFVQQDMRSIALHKPVSVINSTLDGVNYLLKPADVRAFFSSTLCALEPGGVLLFDVSSYFKLRYVLGYNCFGEDNGDEAYIWRNLFDEPTGMLHSDLTLFRRRGDLFERFFEQHTQAAHHTSDLMRMLEDCGFTEICCFGHLTFDPPPENCERIQFAARKPLDFCMSAIPGAAFVNGATI